MPITIHRALSECYRLETQWQVKRMTEWKEKQEEQQAERKRVREVLAGT